MVARFVLFVAGLFYYFLCGLTPVVDSPLFDPRSSGYFVSHPHLISPCVTIGIALFVFGWFGQHDAHCTLAALRGGGQKMARSSGSSHYAIPFGGLFTYVSMPHYFCEMVAYTGLWLVSGMKFSQGSVESASAAQRSRPDLSSFACAPR
jgi:hypothetical protein